MKKAFNELIRTLDTTEKRIAELEDISVETNKIK